jgi:hypothetical protein
MLMAVLQKRGFAGVDLIQIQQNIRAYPYVY